MLSLQAKPVLLVLIVLLGLISSACGSTTPQPPQVVTVVNTVQVEVTREVPVLQTVEVTRDVVVTQFVEVPVTLTPASSPETVATPAPPTLTNTPVLALTPVTPTPTLPSQKMSGFAFLKLFNQTGESITVILNGPAYLSYDIAAGKDILVVVPQGEYTFRAVQNGEDLHGGSLKINNPDKYELKFRNDKVIVLPP